MVVVVLVLVLVLVLLLVGVREALEGLTDGFSSSAVLESSSEAAWGSMAMGGGELEGGICMYGTGWGSRRQEPLETTERAGDAEGSGGEWTAAEAVILPEDAGGDEACWCWPSQGPTAAAAAAGWM